jgi:hypothetical protein
MRNPNAPLGREPDWRIRVPLLRRGIILLAVCGGLFGAGLATSPTQALGDGDVGHEFACAAEFKTPVCERKDKSGTRTPARAEQQRALLDASVAGLAPQRKGVTDLYTIGVAGWAKQDVFIKELDGALASLGKVLPVADRVVRLVNNPETMRTTPLATRQNLAAATRAVWQVMDRDEDVLILLMTSHGSPRGFALQVPGTAPAALRPAELAKIMAGEGIRNRVAIVSACYSGIFVKPLASESTIVMTAADERHPSFGCAPGRDWTYFGDALFNQSLRPGLDFQRAFANARMLVSGWELKEGLQPSNPQAHFGSELVEKLKPLFAAHAGARR